jgi:CBS domain containing-hemolysin-like protein
MTTDQLAELSRVLYSPVTLLLYATSASLYLYSLTTTAGRREAERRHGRRAEVAGFVVALGFVVFLHLVFGEMVPKNAAISSPQATLLWLVVPYRLYLLLFRPVVRALNTLANLGCRMVGVRPRDDLGEIHSTEEIAAIVTQSHQEGVLPQDEAELLSRYEPFTGAHGVKR